MIRHSQGSVFAIALMATVTLCGCSAHQRLATQAVNFNLAVEKAQNEMLLLNVVRAKDRLPMYLTGMSTLSGNVQTTLSATVGGSYTRAKGSTKSMMPSATDMLTHAYTPSAMASEVENPSYTLAVLDTQEFMLGFLSPVAKGTLAYYWNQGWPPELLLYLLVNRVELVKQIVKDGKIIDGPKFVLNNYPKADDPSLKDMKCFGRWVRREFLARNPQVDAVAQPEDIGPPLTSDEVRDLDDLVKAAKEGLALTKDETKETFQLQRKKEDIRFTFPPPPEISAEAKRAEKAKLAEEDMRTNEGKLCKDLVDFLAQEDHQKGNNQNGPNEKDSSSKGKYNQAYVQSYFKELAADNTRIGMVSDSMKINFVLRSPEALLYYLGELTRVANRQSSPQVPYVCIQEHLQPLFLALPAGTCKETFVDADIGRESFSIPAKDLNRLTDSCEAGQLRFEAPDCDTGRSMQTLRLLSQVMSLQKSAKDLPTTTLVRVIGQ